MANRLIVISYRVSSNAYSSCKEGVGQVHTDFDVVDVSRVQRKETFIIIYMQTRRICATGMQIYYIISRRISLSIFAKSQLAFLKMLEKRPFSMGSTSITQIHAISGRIADSSHSSIISDV